MYQKAAAGAQHQLPGGGNFLNLNQAAMVNDAPVLHQVKLAWGRMWLCTAVECPGGTTQYSSFKPAVPGEAGAAGGEEVQHTMPSLLCRDPDTDAFQYAAQLKEIQATCLSGMIPVEQGGPDVQVFMPYRPVGRHG
jgi:hypothetical protein